MADSAGSIDVLVQVRRPVLAADVHRLCDQVLERLIAVDAARIVCDLPVRADVGVLDLLARMRLLAARHGASLVVLQAGEDLGGLLELSGLAEVVGPLEPGRQAEPGEQRRLQEVVDVHDLPR